ncbi:MAG: hypothetical protein WKF88_08850 [Ferruginibacter sp.]
MNTKKLLQGLLTLAFISNSGISYGQTNKVSSASPIKARYQCYRLLISGNQVADDLYILSENQYKTMNKTGAYSYNPKSKTLSFSSGPLAVTEKWVGVYTGKGERTPAGGKTISAFIEIRRLSDVNAGNLRVLQQCNCVN